MMTYFVRILGCLFLIIILLKFDSLFNGLNKIKLVLAWILFKVHTYCFDEHFYFLLIKLIDFIIFQILIKKCVVLNLLNIWAFPIIDAETFFHEIIKINIFIELFFKVFDFGIQIIQYFIMVVT